MLHETEPAVKLARTREDPWHARRVTSLDATGIGAIKQETHLTPLRLAAETPAVRVSIAVLCVHER